MGTLVAIAGTRSVLRERSEPADLQRLVPILPVSDDATVEQVVSQSGWTEYEDFGTVKIGRIVRPARLFAGARRWTNVVRVPRGGARYEAYVGAVGGAVTVRVTASATAAFEVSAPADEWTRVSIDLDSRRGSRQTLTVEVHAASDVVTAWGSEIVSPLQRSGGRPDVILISLDTVRRDQLTPYAPLLATTPHLAALAREGIRFDQAITTSSWTIGSHSMLFTGQFPSDSLGYQSRVEPREYTLPEIFAGRGYRTFGVSGGPYTDPRWGLHQGFDEYVVSGARENAREATSRAIEWMRNDLNAPAFLFLNLFDAHEPLELSEHVRKFTGVTDDVPRPMWLELDSGERPITAEVRTRLLNAYRAELRAIDEQLAKLFAYLKDSARWERTVIIVWADHGQLLGERGYIGHAYTLDEELLNVPLIIKPSGDRRRIPAVYPHLIQEDDLFELFQALAGIPTDQGAKTSASIAANSRIRRLGFSKIHHDPLPELVVQRRWRSATQWAVRDERHKIVRDLEGRSVAYDIAGQEERVIPVSSVDNALATALERFRSWTTRRPPSRTVGPLSPAEIERLRALGYIQ